MDIEKIKQIICGGENVTTEFKECLDRVSNSVYETICSFLNHKGGTIFLGVKDDGEIVGVNSSSVNQLVKTLINASNNPELFIPYANVRPDVIDVDGKIIIMLEILPSQILTHLFECFGSFCHPVFGQVLGSPGIKMSLDCSLL